MQHQRIFKRIGFSLAAVLWVLGLLLAGSDSPHMPWANMAGVFVFAVVNVFLGRTLRRLEKTPAHLPEKPVKTMRRPVVLKGRCGRSGAEKFCRGALNPT